MAKDDPWVSLDVAYNLVRQGTKGEELVLRGWTESRRVAELGIPVRHLTGHPGS